MDTREQAVTTEMGAPAEDMLLDAERRAQDGDRIMAADGFAAALALMRALGMDTRPAEARAAAHGYSASWTEDGDLRLRFD